MKQEDVYLVQSVQVSITIVCIVGKCRIKDIGPLRWCGHVFSRPPFRLALIIHKIEPNNLSRPKTDIQKQKDSLNLNIRYL